MAIKSPSWLIAFTYFDAGCAQERRKPEILALPDLTGGQFVHGGAPELRQ